MCNLDESYHLVDLLLPLLYLLTAFGPDYTTETLLSTHLIIRSDSLYESLNSYSISNGDTCPLLVVLPDDNSNQIL